MTDTNIALGTPTIVVAVAKKGKFMRVKIANDAGNVGDTDAFIVNIVQ